MPVFVFHKIRLSSDSFSRLEKVREEVVDPAVMDFSGRVDKADGDRLLLTFLKPVEAELYARRMLQDEAVRSSTLLILECDFDPMSREVLNIFRDLVPQVESREGAFLAGKMSLCWFSAARAVYSHQRWPICELSPLEQSTYDEGVSFQRVKRSLLKVCAIILMVGLLWQGLVSLVPLAASWARNAEVEELLQRREDLPRDLLLRNIHGLKIARYGVGLETILSTLCHRTWFEFYRRPQELELRLMDEISPLLKQYPLSSSLSFFQKLFSQTTPNGLLQLFQEKGEHSLYRWCAAMDRAMALQPAQDPWHLILEYPNLMDEPQAQTMAEEFLSNGLERVLEMNVMGREQFLLDLAQRLPAGLYEAVVSESLADSSGIRFQSALLLYIRSPDLTGLKLREILARQLDRRLLKPLDLQMLLSVSCPFSGQEFLAEWLYEQGNRMKLKAEDSELALAMLQLYGRLMQ